MRRRPVTAPMPPLDGVRHRFVDLGTGVVIHVAEAGPADGPPVLLVHGFPQHWWEWRHLIAPLAADGYRVLCPDLRGAGWSSAPRGSYRKLEMADDLAAVLDRLDTGPVALVAHDWGGPVAFIMMLRHPTKVIGYFGMNTVGPWLKPDMHLVRHLWRFWYQIPIALPVVGPRLVADRKGRFLRVLAGWVGGPFTLQENDFQHYVAVLGEQSLPWRSRGGTEPFSSGSSCRGCVENSPTNVPRSQYGGCTAPRTRCSHPRCCAATQSVRTTSRSSGSMVSDIGSPNNAPS